MKIEQETLFLSEQNANIKVEKNLFQVIFGTIVQSKDMIRRDALTGIGFSMLAYWGWFFIEFFPWRMIKSAFFVAWQAKSPMILILALNSVTINGREEIIYHMEASSTLFFITMFFTLLKIMIKPVK